MHEACIMKLVIFNGFSIYINTHTHTHTHIYIYIYISDFFFYKSSGLYDFYYWEGQGEVRQKEACV